MNEKPGRVGWLFILIWLVGSLLGIIAGFAIFFITMSALSESTNDSVSLQAAILIMAICFGTPVGLAQWSILRKLVPLSTLWVGATLLGFLLSGPVIFSFSGWFGPNITSQANIAITLALGSALGVVQWLVIRKKVSRGVLWIAISLLSWVLAGLAGLALKSLSYEFGPLLYWLGLLFTGVIFPVAGMLWLLKQAKSPVDALVASYPLQD